MADRGMPARGEKYNGPDGRVEVVAADGAFEDAITVRPDGGGEERKVPLKEWRQSYVYSPGDETELTRRAREGFEHGDGGNEEADRVPQG